MAGFGGLAYGLSATVPGMLKAQSAEDEHTLEALRALVQKQTLEQNAQKFPLEQAALRARTRNLNALSGYYGGSGGAAGYDPTAAAWGLVPGAQVPPTPEGAPTPQQYDVWKTAPPQSPMPGEQSMPASFNERFGSYNMPVGVQPSGEVPEIHAGPASAWAKPDIAPPPVPPSASAGAPGVPPTAQPGAGPAAPAAGPARPVSADEALARLLQDPAYLRAPPREKNRMLGEHRAIAAAQAKKEQAGVTKQRLQQAEKRLEGTAERFKQTQERLATNAVLSKQRALIGAYGRIARINYDIGFAPKEQQPAMQAEAARINAEIQQIKTQMGAPAQSSGPPPPDVRQKIHEAVDAHKGNPEAVSAILLHGWQQGYDMSEFYTGGQEPPAR